MFVFFRFLCYSFLLDLKFYFLLSFSTFKLQNLPGTGSLAIFASNSEPTIKRPKKLESEQKRSARAQSSNKSLPLYPISFGIYLSSLSSLRAIQQDNHMDFNGLANIGCNHTCIQYILPYMRIFINSNPLFLGKK